MLVDTLRALFTRDLKRLKKEIELYSDEANLWKVERSIINSAGNLAYHLVGNLNWFIGTQIGNSGYIRKRELEFSIKDVPRAEILQMIDDTIKVVDDSITGLSDSDLEKDYPLIVFKDKMKVGYFLIHLNSHLTYHTGQVNYHRRLLDV